MAEVAVEGRVKSRAEIEEEALSVVRSLDKIVGNKTIKMLRSLGKAIKIGIESRHRTMLVVTGSDPRVVGAVTARTLLYFEKVYRRTAGRRPLRVAYFFHDEFDDARLRKEITKRAIKEKASLLEQVTARYEESEKYLGTTFQGLVLDLTNDLKPNDVGRLIGIVEGGGLIILQAPGWSEWDTKVTLFKKNLLVPGFEEPRHIFISWFKRKLIQYKEIFIYDTDSMKLLKGEPPSNISKSKTASQISIPEKSMFPDKLYRLALTQDQVNVIKSIEKLYEKPGRGKKRVIIVTADRGRGKSCAVGIGLIGLARELGRVKHRVRILVTAPSLSNVQSLMELALKAAEVLDLKPKPIKRGGMILEIQGKGFSLEYWEPVTITKLQADIVAVDEASGIHVPLLHKIWKAHRRLIFAATIHGYEGAGRGFSVRFLKRLKEDKNTEIELLSMHEPIRYAENDPIEKWLFDVLLLDAEPAELDEVDLEDIREGRLEYLRLDPNWLFSREGEEVLRQLFGIYVLAHYRNEPDDLGMLADAPHHSIRAIKTARGGKIVGAAQIALEGGLDDDTIDKLLRGEKIAGNIIPDRLLKHSRIKEYGRMLGWRIVRIATHPDVQNMGIGSRLLEKLYEESIERGHDWLGSGFGVNAQLMRFWAKNGFVALHLSPDRNPVSGEYTTLVLKPIKDVARRAVEVSSREFKYKLLNSLYDTYNDLETEIALQMLNQDPPGIKPGCKPKLTPIQRDRLWVYNWGPMTYEAATDIINKLAKAYWMQAPSKRPRLSTMEEWILVAKVLQGKSWEEVADELNVKPYKVMVTLKEVMRKMAKHYFGQEPEDPVGVGLQETEISLEEEDEYGCE